MSTSVSNSVGVERNAASRFVDFSCSTDWEKSVLKIENLIRMLVVRGKDNDCELLTLQGIKLKICFHCDLTSKPNYFSSLFDIKNRYILISRAGNDWLDCTTSQKHTLFSVLVTALHSCSDSLNDDSEVPPIFLTMVKDEDIPSSRTLDIMGYQIFKRLDGSTVVSYASHSQNYNLLDAKDEFRYVDSLSKLFEKHVALHQRSTDYPKFASDVIVQVTLESSIKLATVSDHFMTSKMEARTFPMVLEQIARLNEIYIPMNGRKRSIQGAHDITLYVALSYPPMKVTSVVDNESYSTLVPSKQAFHCWSARAHFNTKGWNTVVAAVSYSSCLRRLLALFMYRKSDGSGSYSSPVPTSSMGDGIGSECNPTEKSISMAAVLSDKTMQVLCTMCLNNDCVKNVQEEEMYIQRLLDLAFLGNLSAEEKSKRASKSTAISSPFFLTNDTLRDVETCAVSNIELLSLYAMCAGSLQCFASFSTLWSRYLLALRAHWDDGAPLPGVNGPVKGPSHSDSTKKPSSYGGLRGLGPQGERALDCDTPLSKQLLWGDVICRKDFLSNFDPISVVDRSLPILAQKLKALQFCIVVKNESVLFESSEGGVVLQRRLPLTRDSVSQREYILEKLRPVELSDEIPILVAMSENMSCLEGETLGVPCAEGEGCQQCVTAVMSGDTSDPIDSLRSQQGEVHAVLVHTVNDSMNADNNINNNSNNDNSNNDNSNNDNSYSNNNNDSDVNRQSLDGADQDKDSAADSDEFLDTRSEEVSSALLQYWRVEMDVLISDMRAWKDFNRVGNDVTMIHFKSFLDWYCGEESESVIKENKTGDNTGSARSDLKGREVQIEEGGEVVLRGTEDVQLRSRKVNTLQTVKKKDEEKIGSSLIEKADKENATVDSTSTVLAGHAGSNRIHARVRTLDFPSPSERAIWGILWRNCTLACSASEQKAMFNAETEVEKVLGYLGALAPEQLASELILAAMSSYPPCLTAQVEGHVGAVTALVQRLSPTSDTSSVGRILGQEKELKQLCEAVLSAASEMTSDTRQYEERRKEATVSQAALLSVDKVAELTEKIEEYSQRVTSLTRTLDHAFRNLDKDVLSVFASVLPPMIHSMCSSEGGDFAPCSAKEATACAQLAHFISQTTYAELKAEIAAATEDSESFDDKTQKSDSTHTIENEKKTVKKTEKKWIPTEKIIKMWVGKKGQEHEDPELGSELSVQRMRASVTADSLMLCLRLAQEEYY